jgi:hypothetical protein
MSSTSISTVSPEPILKLPFTTTCPGDCPGAKIPLIIVLVASNISYPGNPAGVFNFPKFAVAVKVPPAVIGPASAVIFIAGVFATTLVPFN